MGDATSGSASAGGAGTSEVEDKDAYTVGWICALPLEMAAASLMLDKIYDVQIDQDSADHNSYILGLMQGHNVVIACLPDGIYGTNPAATVAKDMLRTFKSIRFGLLVGVGGGAPSSENDIRLGDVVVSKPTGTSGGVIQYDRGKTTQHKIERTGSLNAPPTVLLTALSRLQARQKLGQSDIPQFLSEAVEKIKKPKIRQKFAHQGDSNDRLFKSECGHDNADSNCDGCDLTQTIEREDRDDTEPVVHYGNIASGNQVIKHGKTRDELSKEFGALCFEMEAAGLMQEFPCLVIRGICDYSDAHKNKRWQEYAATTAAAFAKELLSIVSSGQVKKENKIVLDPKLYTLVSDIRNDIRNQRQEQQARYADEKDRECLRALSRTDSFVDKEYILEKKDKLLRKSYGWIMDNPEFRQWRNSTQSRRLWIKGDPGKGKTMLLCGIIEELENSNHLCYFFCQATEERLSTANAVLRGLILHLVRQYPALISHVRKEYDNKYEATFDGHNAWQDLCKILESMLQDESLGEVLIVVDALDECKNMEGRKKLLRFICKISTDYRAKLIVSSRNWPDIQMQLGRQEDHAVTLSLELNASNVSDAVHSYIDHKMEELARIELYKNNADLCSLVRDHLIHNAKSTFLWVALVCQELSGSKAKSPRNVHNILNRSPLGLDGLYARMIENIFDSEDPEDSRLCVEILAVASVAKRPITFQELFHTITLSRHQGLEPEELKIDIQCCGSFLNIQNDTIYFVHQSAVDFLLSGTSKLPNVAERHYSMFWNSLDALSNSKHLKRDIYDLKAPDVSCADISRPTADPISTLHYCCAYWVDHLVDWAGTEREISTPPSSLMNPDVIGKIQSFLNDKFLYWVEALSLLHRMPQAVQAIQNLQTLVDGSGSQAEQDLSKFINDANRFLLHHKLMLKDFPLQLYASALVFSPRQSTVKRLFQNEVSEWATAILGVGSTWSSCLQTLEDHRYSVGSVAFSPDGQWLVSGDSSGLVKLWNANDGSCVRTESCRWHMDDRRSECCSVMFSSDSKLFIARWCDGTARVWDRATGNAISDCEVTAFCKTTSFPPDSGVDIRAREHQKRQPVQKIGAEIRSHTLNDNTFHVTSSSSGHWLASACSGSGVRIWYAFTRDWENFTDQIGPPDSRDPHIFPRQNHTAVKKVQPKVGLHNCEKKGRGEKGTHVMSNDGQWVAVHMAGIVRIWELETTKLIWTLKQKAMIMAFSGRKELLAASLGENIWVWSMTTGALTGKVGRHPAITSMAFSPDARQIISASSDGTIKVWETPKPNEGVPDNTDPWHMDRHIYYNNEDQFAVCFSGTKHTMVWDDVNRYDLPMAGTYHGDVSSIGFSEDNQQLALGSTNGEITIWDTRSGSCLRKFSEYEESLFDEYCFGKNNFSGVEAKQEYCESKPQQSQAEGSDENAKRKFPVFSLSVYGVTPPRTADITSLFFRGNTQLASNAYGRLNFWNIIDGTCRHLLDNENEWVTLIIFSKDGRWLAYICGEFNENLGNRRMVKIWDMETKQYTLTSPADETGNIETVSISFSADSRQLAKSTYWEITLWDVSSGACIKKLENHNYGFVRILFDARHETRLHTQYGFLDCNRPGRGWLDSITSNPDSADSSGRDNSETVLQKAPASDVLLEAYLLGHGFSRDLKWITLDGKKMLRIPTEFRPSTKHNLYDMTPVVNGRSLLWITKVGRLVRVNFAERD